VDLASPEAFATRSGAVKFADEARAVAFEKYLKSGSGCEFARRHLR
jgi:hypothetical protein